MTLLIHSFLGLLLASFVLGVMLQIGLIINLVIIRNNPEQFAVKDLLRAPGGVGEAISTADGGRVEVYHRGSGPAVLLIPEVGSRCVVMNQLWERWAAYGFRVITFDWRGHGPSQAGTWGLSLAGFEADLAAVVQHMQLQGGLWLGYATGGFLAMHHLAQQPSAAHRPAYWVSLCGYGQGQAVAGPRRNWLARWGQQPWGRHLLRHRLFGWGYAGAAFGDRVSPALVRAYLHLLRQAPTASLEAFWAEVAAQDLGNRLPLVPVPSLVIASPDDQLVSPAQAHWLAEHLPQAELHWVYRGAGHMLPWEQPAAVVEAVREFMARQEARPAPISH